jgi:hypothetical protein
MANLKQNAKNNTSNDVSNDEKGDISVEKKDFSDNGLYLTGTVISRAKRLVGENKTELVNYQVNIGNAVIYMKDWRPNGKYFTVGEVITVPIFIKIFAANGNPRIEYTLKKEREEGEDF